MRDELVSLEECKSRVEALRCELIVGERSGEAEPLDIEK
ncbi:MAG: type II toxin-antitoxin system ParD family antitoxin [Pikeienuella sp.]